MEWIAFAVSLLLAAVWLVALKESEGFARGWYVAATLVVAAMSVALLSYALHAWPARTTFAMWAE
jgi:multidrug transporter EmrE-like cation transporter